MRKMSTPNDGGLSPSVLCPLTCYRMLNDDFCTAGPLNYIVHWQTHGMYGRENNGVQAAFLNEEDAKNWINTHGPDYRGTYKIWITKDYFAHLAKVLPDHAKRFETKVLGATPREIADLLRHGKAEYESKLAARHGTVPTGHAGDGRAG